MPVAVLSGQHTAAKRRPGQHPDPEPAGRADRVRLGVAGQQRVLDLVGHRHRATWPGLLPGDGPGRLPAGVVRHADVPDPARVHRVVERGQRLLQRYVVRPAVQLPQVDVVDVQPSQRRLEVTQQGAPRGVGDPLAAADAEPGLGRDDQVVAVRPRRRAATRSGARCRRRRTPPRCRSACRRRRRTRRAARAPRARRCRGPRTWCPGRACSPPVHCDRDSAAA